MTRMIDKDYLLLHTRKVRFFGIGPDDESWGYAVPVEVIENAPTLTQPNEWVSVEERLPEHLKDVLALYGNGKIDIDWVDSSGNFKFGSLFDGVTHWMPLPAPPDKDNNVLAKTPNDPLTLEQLRASPHGKIKDSTLQNICNRANEIACCPPEGEEDT